MFQDAPQFVNYVEQLHHWLLYMVRQKFHSSSKVKHSITRNFWRPLYKICSRSGWITNMKIEHFELVFLRLFVSSKDFCTSTIFWTQIEHRIHIRIRNIGFQVWSYILFLSSRRESKTMEPLLRQRKSESSSLVASWSKKAELISEISA